MHIHLLPEHVIDQIKAGEVIDSPAGIIKEILENAIDAKSNMLDLHIIDNGMELIALKDNGKGIHFEDLPYAFARHATSKLSRFEDIYKNTSFGFRGEALASLASVSKVKCESTLPNGETQVFNIEGGQTKLHEKLEGKKSQGTKIYIKELFYNTPARLKFLTSKNSEKTRIKKMLNYFLLGHPEIEFKIQWDDKDKNIYQKSTTKERLQKIIREFDSNIRSFDYQFDDLEIQLFLSTNERPRPIQFFYVNGRPVEDDKVRNTVNHTLLSLGHTKKCDWVIKLKIPQHKIDVNVHPKKTSIKFFQSSLVYSFISNTVKKSLQLEKKQFEKELSSPDQVESDPSDNISRENYPPSNHAKLSPTSQNSFELVRSDSTDISTGLVIENFFLFSLDDKFYLCETEKAGAAIYRDILSPNTAITPLLVSEPLYFEKEHSDKIQKTIALLNIELTAIDGKSYLIKSLPKILLDTHYKTLVESIISQLLVNIQSDLEKSWIKCFRKTCPLFIKTFLKKNQGSFEKLICNKTITEVTPEKLQSLL